MLEDDLQDLPIFTRIDLQDAINTWLLASLRPSPLQLLWLKRVLAAYDDPALAILRGRNIDDAPPTTILVIPSFENILVEAMGSHSAFSSSKQHPLAALLDELVNFPLLGNITFRHLPWEEK